jgi:hypothetical protein
MGGPGYLRSVDFILSFLLPPPEKTMTEKSFFSLSSATFNDGNVLAVNIVAGAGDQGFGSPVGSGKNNFQSYQIFKDDSRQVFESGGWTFTSIWWCA